MSDAELDDRGLVPSPTRDHSPTPSSSTPITRTDSPAPADDQHTVLARMRRGAHLLPRRTVIFLIELYRTWVSPLRLPTCRFEPTCSGYAVEALERHGFLYGSALATIRLLKCGPWHKPGYDPVPDKGPRELWSDFCNRVRELSGGQQSAHRGRTHQPPSRRNDST
ncbi:MULTISPECIES: membrane protein insertion efficiency factor YidD [Gordonia]|uniref:membrane protein insertion efficiency factor YidD n=1 Tax=Gordonia TaxID=2053 RepID=UPI0013316BC9|nr:MULTISPECIES: membrane protein insertion efficiency factor YidD [Gordonia]KAF0971260.1 putative membrane protein insertion efficiency factor [Gordonia sp. YY1]MCZ4651046.1 membrane protein insertion efficiency factor YidD [Gordonia amicalis]